MSILILACLLAICLPVLSVPLSRIQDTTSRIPLPIFFPLFLLFFLPLIILFPFIFVYYHYTCLRRVDRLLREDRLTRERRRQIRDTQTDTIPTTGPTIARASPSEGR
jgi:hypothetical protein